MRRAVFALVLLALLNPAAAQSVVTPEHFAQAAAFSRAHGGLGLRVQYHGQLLFEDYPPGDSSRTPHPLFSGTKNFTMMAALLAEQDGLLTLDEPASLTLPEWQQDRRREITLRQLLSHTSGLNPDGDLIYGANDQYAAALHVPLIDPPGTRFHYGAVGYQAFGEILKRKLQPRGLAVDDYIQSRLLDPLEIHVAEWKRDNAGQLILHTGLRLSTYEWCKLGEFIRHSGVFQQKQLLDSKLFKQLFLGQAANPAYGLSFWLNTPLPAGHLQPIEDLQPAIDGDQIDPGGPSDLYSCVGSGKQRLYIIPSLGLVIARFGEGGPFSDGDFLSRLLTGQPNPDAHTH